MSASTIAKPLHNCNRSSSYNNNALTKKVPLKVPFFNSLVTEETRLFHTKLPHSPVKHRPAL